MKDTRSQDDFWDLEKLLPQKRPAPFVREREEISLRDMTRKGENSDKAKETHLSFATQTEKSLEKAPLAPTVEKIGEDPCENAPNVEQDRREHTERIDAVGVSSRNSGIYETTVGRTEDKSKKTVLSVGERYSSGELGTSVTYTPKKNPFLLSVTVTRKKSIYSFYEHFTKDARRYFAVEGEADAPYVPFFSYIPQYSQLSEEQKRFYFSFRRAMREGRVVKTDFSYFMLLVYEILNLPELVPPEKGISFLCTLWTGYRRDFPQMDKYLAVWIPDYCLLHGLPAPTEALSEILPEVLRAADFKEFYLGNAAELSPAGIDALVALASDYRYRYSRYATEENRALFDRAMYGALHPVLCRLLSEEGLGILAGERTREGEAFTGSLCAHNLRARLSVKYHPFAETPRFRTVLSQAVKYIENKLRAHLAIKSRLSVTGLPPEYKLIVNRYFDTWEEPEKKPRESDAEKAYLALYEAESHGFSAEESAAIEAASWETTRRLVEEETFSSDEGDEALPDVAWTAGAFSTESLMLFEEAPPAPPAEARTRDELPTPSGIALRYGLSMTAYRYLVAVFQRDMAEALRILQRSHTAASLLFEEINGAFYIHFGDIILEGDASAPTVIEDYREDVAAFIENDGVMP